jgi:hypothetical protein
MVDPLMRHPIAIAAVKGPVDAPLVVVLEVGVPETASLLSKLTKLAVDAFSKEGAAFDD